MRQFSRMQVPPQWPEEAKKKYEPIRILGKGGFASVILANVRIQWESQKAYNRQPRPIYHGMDI